MVGAVQVVDGKFVSWNVRNMTTEQILDRVVASASVPGMFGPASVDGTLFYDGGVAKGLNILDGI